LKITEGRQGREEQAGSGSINNDGATCMRLRVAESKLA
jgi:hypothetical protein